MFNLWHYGKDLNLFIEELHRSKQTNKTIAGCELITVHHMLFLKNSTLLKAMYLECFLSLR
jgi:hypothetical protein